MKLRNLQLKKSALQEIDLPIEVKAGFLGELSIEVSWKALSSQPVVVRISDVFLLACPTSRDPQEEASLKLKRERSFRQKRLQFAELIGEDPLSDTAKEESKDVTKGESFTEKAVKKIVNNLQVYIERVHVRFEDGVTSSEKIPWALGVTLQGVFSLRIVENVIF